MTSPSTARQLCSLRSARRLLSVSDSQLSVSYYHYRYSHHCMHLCIHLCTCTYTEHLLCEFRDQIISLKDNIKFDCFACDNG